ncbi:MAG: hypothetical protein EBU93_07325 [Chlamydiae bacterium]|nr:hypothetical protein [Chlamydiota bacterium]
MNREVLTDNLKKAESKSDNKEDVERLKKLITENESDKNTISSLLSELETHNKGLVTEIEKLKTSEMESKQQIESLNKEKDDMEAEKQQKLDEITKEKEHCKEAQKVLIEVIRRKEAENKTLNSTARGQNVRAITNSLSNGNVQFTKPQNGDYHNMPRNPSLQNRKRWNNSTRPSNSGPNQGSSGLRQLRKEGVSEKPGGGGTKKQRKPKGSKKTRRKK